MASFVSFANSNEVTSLYRPKRSVLQAPKAWWRYGILATLHRVRERHRVDLWRLVSEKNETLLERLLEEHPPLVVRMKKELESLRAEVSLLRAENDTLRQMLSDALEPSARASASQREMSRVHSFEEIPEEEILRPAKSVRSLASRSRSRVSSIVTVEDLSDEEERERDAREEEQSRSKINERDAEEVEEEEGKEREAEREREEEEEETVTEVLQRRMSSLSSFSSCSRTKSGSASAESSEVTTLLVSPYEIVQQSPFARPVRETAIKPSRSAEAPLNSESVVTSTTAPELLTTAMNAVTRQTVCSSIDNPSFPSNTTQTRRATDIRKTLHRSAQAHMQRMTKAAEITIQKQAMELVPILKFEKTEFETSDNEFTPKVEKLPLDDHVLSREERIDRAKSVYSPRTVPSPDVSPRRGRAVSSSQRRDASTDRTRSSSTARGRANATPRSNMRKEATESESPRYPVVTADLSPSQRVAIEIIASVRLNSKNGKSPEAKKPLTKTELSLLNSPFAKPLLSPRDREQLSPRTQGRKPNMARGKSKVHDEGTILQSKANVK